MSRIILLGEAWGRDEAAAKRPFVGATGRELNRLLEESGILPAGTARPLNDALYRNNYRYRDEVYHAAGLFPTNVLNFQPPGNRIEDLCGGRWGTFPPIRPGKYLRQEFVGELDRLHDELRREKPNLIIGLGATALWALSGTGQISKRRGTIFQSEWGKAIVTFHPAFLMRGAWNMRPIVLLDLIKAARESAYPELRRPQRWVHVPECIDDIGRCFPRLRDADRISIDIETAGDQITCIGFAWSTTEALVIPIVHNGKPDRSYWNANEEPIVWSLIREICGLGVPKVFQNGLYDIHFLWRRYAIPVCNVADDTMLLHHALQPEVQKGLGFLGSLYTEEPAWKMMRPRGKGTIKREDE